VTDPASNTTHASLTRKIIRIPDSTPHPAVVIDESQRLIVSGKPMFPIGLYFFEEQMNETVMAMIEASDYNVVMPCVDFSPRRPTVVLHDACLSFHHHNGLLITTKSCGTSLSCVVSLLRLKNTCLARATISTRP
jgi:hypothetical protein